MAFCKIVLTKSLQTFSDQTDNALSYAIPEDLSDKLAVGSMVLVPFRNQKENGLVIDIYNQLSAEEENFRIREIEELLSDEILYPQELINLIKFVSHYYSCSYSEVVQSVLPNSLFQKAEKLVRLLDGDYAHPVIDALKRARKQEAKWTRLKALTKLKEPQLKKEVAKLKSKNLIEIEYISRKTKARKVSNPLERLENLASSEIPELTQEQKQVLDCINAKQGANKFLLHGVTGSGKTEVYLRLIEETFKQNKSVILLIPEISLAPQLVERVAKRFGDENTLIWHSALSKSEREFTLNALADDQPKVIIGARSAIFAPLRNIGLIVLDEEHENSYKQDSPNPRYHAREVAIKRAELNNCPVVFGSATPSVELYYKAANEDYSDYHLLKLTKRVFDNPLPHVTIVDMTEEFNNANKSIFSRYLKSKIDRALEEEEQVILFLNKRGSASHVFCRNCGFVYQCSNCDSKTVYHADKQLMLCHHCGFSEAHPTECPTCSSKAIKFFGLGTQKLEQETKRHFPEAEVARLDSDVSRIQNNYIDTWSKFRKGEIDILIGTQMVAKGLDLANLTTVGVISADSNFSQLDYQADERGFQLLTQVAGRAGRADKEGHVIFQTYQPERATLLDAQVQDYESFYAKEIEMRKEFAYPPFGTLIRVLASAEEEYKAINTTNEFHKLVYDKLKDREVSILGPCPSLIARLKNKFRYHIVFKVPRNESHDELCHFIKETHRTMKKETSFTIDIDNINLY